MRTRCPQSDVWMTANNLSQTTLILLFGTQDQAFPLFLHPAPSGISCTDMRTRSLQNFFFLISVGFCTCLFWWVAQHVQCAQAGSSWTRNLHSRSGYSREKWHTDAQLHILRLVLYRYEVWVSKYTHTREQHQIWPGSRAWQFFLSYSTLHLL